MKPPADPTQVSLRIDSAGAMRRLANHVGRVLQIGDVVALTGPLGAGKTTFVQGLAEGVGVPAERHVASPTFALVNEHPGRIDFVHVDFYRIQSPAELPELGIEEAYDRAATAIEWAERFPDWLPDDTLHLVLEVEDSESRVVRAQSSGPRSQALLRALATASRD
ncbi:MAG TPA: tRNA (adenosine(37)-N6)-threonylcarbamoyltransferase complex ATPase subunit type 1 TsaE [Polyangia bacterium]